MKKPTPNRYCPIIERDRLFLDIMKEVPSDLDLVKPIQNCLCNSVAYANIICDPSFCTKHLTDGVKWAVTTENPMAATGGVGKKVYRMYAKQRDQDIKKQQDNFFKSLDDFFEPD
jgi:hypothetical protein